MRLLRSATVAIMVVTGLIATFAIGVSALDSDPMVGTWKLNVARSSFNPGPPPESGLVVIKKVDDKTNTALDLVLNGGRKIHFEYTGAQDGSDTPVPGGGNVDAVAERRINIRTVARDDKKNGKVTRHQYATLSADGKTLTLEIATINAQGVPVNDIQVYEKQ